MSKNVIRNSEPLSPDYSDGNLSPNSVIHNQKSIISRNLDLQSLKITENKDANKDMSQAS